MLLVILALVVAQPGWAQDPGGSPTPLPAGTLEAPETAAEAGSGAPGSASSDEDNADDDAAPAASPDASPEASAEATAPLPAAQPVEPATPPPAAPATPPVGPATPAPTPALVAPVTPPPPRTVWEPFDKEVVRTADGSMDVCAAIALPLTIVPGVGDIVGTVADWFCIIPAAIAVDYAGAFHGKRESHFWQPALGLVLKKGFETLVDTPIIVVTIGAAITIAAGGVAAAFYGGLPVTLVTTGAVGVTLAVYLGLRGFRDAIGNFLFEKTYNVLVDERSDEALAPAREASGLKPAVDGIPGGFGLMATVAGSKPSFNWAHAVPVLGPIWRSGDNADNIKRRVRRYANEVLLVDKPDLGGMDTSAEILSGVQGYSMAAGHVGLGVGVGLFGAGLAVALTDQNNENQGLAEVLGGVGIVSVLGGVGGIVVSQAAERLQPIVVPLAWGAADDPVPDTADAAASP